MASDSLPEGVLQVIFAGAALIEFLNENIDDIPDDLHGPIEGFEAIFNEHVVITNE